MGLLLNLCKVRAIALLCVILPFTASQSLPELRIMPLGDSITKGNGASDNTGYRKRLRQKLLAYETTGDNYVDMIGTLSHGSMVDNDHQGHSGRFLADMQAYLSLSIEALPNVVLVHAGTNNMDLEIDLSLAPDLMTNIIDDLFDGSPQAVVIVMPVIWANDQRMQRNTDTFNAKVKTIVEKKQESGKHILLAPSPDITKSDLDDKKHPNDQGYEKMAVSWFNAILDANKRGWISDPEKVNIKDLPNRMGLGYADTGTSPGDDWDYENWSWNNQGKIFDGFRVWDEVGTISKALGDESGDKVILADLNNDGMADYIVAYDDGTVAAWLYGGSPNKWTSLGDINPDWRTIKGEMIRMADVDGDGKADMIALYSDGAARVWRNVDNGKKFESLDSKWASGIADRSNVYFQDMDGDGRADYVIVYSGGSVKWARNTGNNGKDSGKRNWEKEESIAPGPAGIPSNRASIQDIDGDGMADYLIIYEGGSVVGYSNTGALADKNEEGGSRRLWQLLGTVVPGVSGVNGNMIRFADMDGDGLPDMVAVASDGSIRMWKNNGIVGTKGNSMRFANVSPSKGVDIVVVDHRGRARAWANKGVKEWEDLGEIAPGPKGDDLSAARIVFHDVNGDGLDDYLIIFAGGAVKGYINNGNIGTSSSGRLWSGPYTISPGIGEPGRKISFADLNGDGCADFLVIFDGGAVDAWLNNCADPDKFPPSRIWGQRKTIATGVGEPGSKVRFADLTGDGRAEYIIQYTGGSSRAYLNSGNIPDVGKERNWISMGTAFAGAGVKTLVHYADIDGDGKADHLGIAESGAVYGQINECECKVPSNGGGSGGDDDDDDEDDDDGDDGGSGGDNWTCDDVLDEARSDGTFPQDLWDKVGVEEYFNDWFDDNRDSSNLAGSLGQDWGLDGIDCTISGGCNLDERCSSYDPQKDSGPPHLVFRAMKNLHEYYQRLGDALDDAADHFGVLEEVFQKYWPDEDLEDQGLSLLFGTLNGIVQLFSTVAGGSKTVGAAAGMYGVIGGAVQGALTSGEEKIEHAADLALAASSFIESAQEAIVKVNDRLMTTGSIDTEDSYINLKTLFADGAWLDTTSIAVLNPNTANGPRVDSEELGDWFSSFLHAALVDYSWTRSTVTVVGHEMTKEEYEEGKSKMTYWDTDLMLWENGWAYFLISMESKLELGEWWWEPRNPPGYEYLEEAELEPNFTPRDVIRSSIDSHEWYGYNHQKGPWFDDIIENPDWQGWKDVTPRQGGTFNIPVCYMGPFDTPDPAQFVWDVMNERNPKAFGNYFMCACRNFEDKNGKKWRDHMHRSEALEHCNPGIPSPPTYEG